METKAKAKAKAKNNNPNVVVMQHIPQFNPKTGEAISKPHEQTYGPKEWKLFLQAPNGMEVVEYINLPAGCQTKEEYTEGLRKKSEERAKARVVEAGRRR